MNDLFINPEIIAERRGSLSLASLNRPDKLNALTMDMVRMIYSEVRRAQKNDAIKALLLKGRGGRAFCSGGDIVSFYHAGMDFRRGRISLEVATLFFAEEYSLNRRLFKMDKPTIAYMNGITMGGGFGIAGNTRYPLACEATVFAMPETRIGFFTDVGSVYHLNQIPSEALGRYLVMTGESLHGRDVFDAGLATHFIASEKYDALERALMDGLDAGQDVKGILDSFHAPAGPSIFLSENLGWIERVFAHKSWQEILKALQESPEYNAKKVYEIIRGRAPVSVVMSLEHYNRARGKTFDEVINVDLALAKRFALGHNFYEGIRATLIDRDKVPHWDPTCLEDVREHIVDECFEDAASMPLDEFDHLA